MRQLLTGNDAAAEAVKLSRVQVIAAYPITPQTSIAESLSDFVSKKKMDAPWSLGTDHIDSLSQRDTGWLQFYCEKAQEVLDTVIIAFRLAETVLLPVMILSDGFYLSHFVEPVALPSQKHG